MRATTSAALQLKALYPYHSSHLGISHICLSLCRYMRGPDCDVRVTLGTSEPVGRHDFTRDALPRWLKPLVCRLDRDGSRVKRWAERRFVASLRRGDIAYIWPGTATDVYRRARDKGAFVVAERINCHRATSKPILDRAYQRLNLPAMHGITDESREVETERLQLCDAIFSPSPAVTRSLIEAGIDRQRIMPSSYGYEPQRMDAPGDGLPRGEGVNAVFVGSGCVRKGVDLLLDAWTQAQVSGRLFIIGQLERDIAQVCAARLAAPSVAAVPYMRAVAPAYRSADLFLFPSLEEGSPLVLYEAMAAGLACIVSPMAAGEIARHEQECLVIDPLDTHAWVQAIRALSRDPRRRRSLAERARLRATEFTWEKVAHRRRAQLMERFAAAGHCPASTPIGRAAIPVEA